MTFNDFIVICDIITYYEKIMLSIITFGIYPMPKYANNYERAIAENPNGVYVL
jgi:hypothetical protein